MNHLSQIGECALNYAAEGFAVFPVFEITSDGRCACCKPNCGSAGKHPRTRNGVKEATREEDLIRQWWRQWPDANIGVATGSPSGIFVLDVDLKNNGPAELERLLAVHGSLPDTRFCRTGSGGLHFYFLLPPDHAVSNSASKIAPGIDIRGEGGYVVAPPSNHISGGRYDWL